MKILVTGANGFIGRALCSHLVFLGHEVLPVVRKASGMKNEFIIVDGESLHSILQGCDAVVHLAGLSHAMKKNGYNSTDLFKLVNVDKTLDLAQQAVAAGVRRFIFMSTVKVNGEYTNSGHSFNSISMHDPQDLYSKSKLEAEQGLNLVSEKNNLEVTIIRPPMVYGPGVKGNFHALMRVINWGIPLPLAKIDNLRSMLAIDNLVNFISLCADIPASPNAKNQVFLVSDCHPISTPELLCKISEAYGLKIKLFSFPLCLLRIFGLCLGKLSLIERLTGSLVVDDSKTFKMLGWKPVVSMDEQLGKMVDDTSY